MKPRILAVDDEEKWLASFRANIPQNLAIQDSAITTEKATEFLHRLRYHVVLLDLSMDLGNRFDRANSEIQEYLSTRPEGTTYIIISANVHLQEAINSAFHLNAFYVFPKGSIEPGTLREKVSQAINEASKEDIRILADARRQMTEEGRMEDQILRTLHPTGGAAGMYPMMDALFDRIAPIVPHRDRSKFEVLPNCVVGLVWSRQLGMAVSILLASRKVSPEIPSNQLSDWLGYPQDQSPLFNRDIAGVRVQYFAEPSISDLHFNLPLATRYIGPS
jgi:hypothetical protein